MYRNTSRTLPLSVGTDRDQTQLMIKRVILLRKLSEVTTTITGNQVLRDYGSYGLKLRMTLLMNLTNVQTTIKNFARFDMICFQFFNSSGKRLQVRGHVYESKLEVREKNSGNVKSISVNDLLDQHLSKLTLGLVSRYLV